MKVELTIIEERERHGCDMCKHDYPTEQFVGFCGRQLWICETCFESLSKWTRKDKANARVRAIEEWNGGK